MLMIALMLAQATDVEGGIKKLCAEQWPDDYSMQEYCQDQQWKGAEQFHDLYREAQKSNAKFIPALEKCVHDWENDDIIDWSMVGYCATEQKKSFTHLNR